MARGQVYGRLTVLEFADRDEMNRLRWRFRCECGNEIVLVSEYVRRGSTRSCGCKRIERTREMGLSNITHGKSYSSTHRSWGKMLHRCRCKTGQRYADYGGRGIKVCDRWHQFENFLADMGERPKGHTLDRYPDNDGNYEPGNCRWATAKEQAANRRRPAGIISLV